MLSVFKLKNGSVAVIVAIPVSSNDVEFTNDEEVNNLEKALTKKQSGLSSKGWQTRSWWNHSSVSVGGQRSQDQWRQPNPRGKWKEVFQCSVGFVVFGQG